MDIGSVRCPDCRKRMTPAVAVCDRCGLRLEGRFELSPLAMLSSEDQALVIIFLRSYGSIKKIQEILGVSYPTARLRLERLIERINEAMTAPSAIEAVVDRLHRGEISIADALEQL